MKKTIITLFVTVSTIVGCQQKNEQTKKESEDNLKVNQDSESCSSNSDASRTISNIKVSEIENQLKTINPDLPTIGVLMYSGVLMTEVTAPVDVFSKHSEQGKQMFNVITIAENYEMIVCEEGLKMFPDYIFSNAPKLDVIIVPSAYDMSAKVKDTKLLDFITKQNAKTEYTVSNCGAASLLGETGIADGKKIVTWIGGGDDLQKKYPNLKVQDDSKVSYMEDGKFLSSNGNLASYISSLELLDKMTDKKHRKFVESYLYLDRLQNWKK